MDLQESYNFLLFWVNKFQGSWYPPEELDAITDKGQLSYYKDCFIKYGTGQRLNDALAPFKKIIPFATDSTGLLVSPIDYMDLIDIITTPGGVRVPCPVVNDDEITNRVKSQVIPMSITAPFAEEVSDWNYQLYPQQQQSGFISYFSRPPKPFFSYTVVSGRVIVYNKFSSTQLGWGDDEVLPVLIKTLSTIGINLSAMDLAQWADQKDKENLLSTVKI